MKLIDKAKNLASRFFNKRRDDREFEEKLEREARATEKKIYEQEYRRAALKAAMIKAKRDAETKTGLQKLRAVSRVNSSGRVQPGFFQKLHNYTASNIARREANLKKTQTLQNTAKQMRQERVYSNIQRNQFKSKPFMARNPRSYSGIYRPPLY